MTAALDSFIKIRRHIPTLACAPLGNKDHLDLILSRLIAPDWAHVAAATAAAKEGGRDGCEMKWMGETLS